MKTNQSGSLLPSWGTSIKISAAMPSISRRYFLLLLLTAGWLLALLLPAWATASGWSLGPWLYLPFAQICHQLDERSFLLAGQPLAVCHRCTGIYIGFWLGLTLLPFWPGFVLRLLDRPRLVLWFFLPLGIDFLLQNNPASRFLTGALGGFPVALFAWVAVEQLPKLWGAGARSLTDETGRI